MTRELHLPLKLPSIMAFNRNVLFNEFSVLLRVVHTDLPAADCTLAIKTLHPHRLQTKILQFFDPSLKAWVLVWGLGLGSGPGLGCVTSSVTMTPCVELLESSVGHSGWLRHRF